MTEAKRQPPRNPRRRVLFILTDLGRTRQRLATRWAQSQTKPDDISGKIRPLTEPEKLENQPQEWLCVLRDIQAMRNQLEGLERIAQFQLSWLRAQRHVPSGVPHQRQEVSAR